MDGRLASRELSIIAQSASGIEVHWDVGSLCGSVKRQGTHLQWKSLKEMKTIPVLVLTAGATSLRR